MSTPPILLLADDSVAIQRVVALAFADQPVRLVVARDGQDAINRMETERPDLILADTNMPCVDGYEVAKWVRQQPHLSVVPVLLLAGITDPVDEQRLHDSGANGVLEKPFEPNHVISRVKELLGLKGAATPAPTTRLVTAPEQKAVRRVAAPAAQESASPPEAEARAKAPVAAAPPPSAVAVPMSTDASRAALSASDPFRADVPIDDLFESLEARAAGRESAARPVADSERDWFPGDAHPPPDAPRLATEMGVSGFDISGHADPNPRGIDLDFGAELAARRAAASGASSAALSDHRGAASVQATADVFASLLAAEQGDPPARHGRGSPGLAQAAVPEITDEMMSVLAGRLAERLQPVAMREELQRVLEASLRETLTRTVRDSVAGETRVAVAEAVQTAVDGSVLGTIRGAVNEAVSAAVPPAVEQSVGAHVDQAVRESADRVLSGSVEQTVRDTVGTQVAAVVRHTVEREMRDTVAPIVAQAMRELLASTLDSAVTEAVSAAVSAAVPAAVLEAVRIEAGGHVRQAVIETSERLVREEIERIRERRSP